MQENKKQTITTRSIIITALVLSFLSIGVFIVFMVINTRAKSPPPNINGYKENREKLPEEVIILATNEGFSPEMITIKKGTSVRWINKNTSGRASVNSDDYPTNRLYPELNLGQFQEGATLVHIFNTPGVYTYHNQYNPSHSGQINVE